MCFAPQRRALFRHLNVQKWSEPRVFLTYLTSKCASLHNGVHFFDISTSKSGPDVVCFVHFDLKMCFAPQRRALFRHLNFQKWSGRGVFFTFWLENVLLATTACTFATSKSGPKLVCFVHVDFEMCFAPQRHALFRHLNIQKWSEPLVCFVHVDFEMCFAPQRRALFRHLNVQKWSEPLVFLTYLTSKCASLHNGVHFFDISTSKSGPDVVCFVHFDLKMCFAPQRRALSQLPKVVRTWCVLYIFFFELCFAPQRRALFRHLNCRKWSGPGVFCTFWLGHVLRATTACNFSSLIWPAGSAPASLASLLFDPPEPQNWKTQWIATFLPFRASYSFSSTLISSNLSLLSASSLLCFSSVHIVGSLTSKLPSTNY